MIRARGSFPSGGMQISPDIRPLYQILWYRILGWLK
jgi:hypothetical protein